MLHLARFALTLGLLALSGCALTEDHIRVGYAAQPGVDRIAPPDKVTVLVQVQDQRPSRGNVGHKINGYGMVMAAIIADNDPAQTVKDAVESELTDRDFCARPARAVDSNHTQQFRESL